MGTRDPFLELRTAFDRGQEGRWLDAGVLFSSALSAFDQLLADPETAACLSAIAARISGIGGHAEEVSRELLDRLPVWLREMHFDHFKREIAENRIPAAVSHWQALVFASRLPNLAGVIDLRNLRDLVCQHFRLTAEDLAAGEEAQADCAQRAEKVLKADPDNIAVRYSSIDGYARLMGIRLDRIMPPTRGDLPGLRIPAAQKRRAELSLRRSVPRLRAHLSHTARAQDVNTPIALLGYRQLGRYFVTIGDIAMAIRMSRKARRLAPNDPDLAKWVRYLRRMGRSK